MRSNFEKAYEPNPHKSPFTEVRFNEEKQIYEPLNPPLDRVARSLNAAWYGYRIRQTEVDELQKKNAWLSDVAERENKRANKLQEEKVSTTTLLGKTIQEKNDLQKRVDEQGLIIAKVMSIASDLQKSWEMFEIGKKLEQALKGEHA